MVSAADSWRKTAYPYMCPALVPDCARRVAPTCDESRNIVVLMAKRFGFEDHLALRSSLRGSRIGQAQ